MPDLYQRTCKRALIGALSLSLAPIAGAADTAFLHTETQMRGGDAMGMAKRFMNRSDSSKVGVAGAIQVTATGKQRVGIDLDKGVQYTFDTKGRRCKAQSLESIQEAMAALQDLDFRGGNSPTGAGGDNPDFTVEVDFEAKKAGTKKVGDFPTGNVTEFVLTAWQVPNNGGERTKIAVARGNNVTTRHTAETRAASEAVADWQQRYVEAIGFEGDMREQLQKAFAQAPILGRMNEELSRVTDSNDELSVEMEVEFLVAAPTQPTGSASSAADAAGGEPKKKRRFGLGNIGSGIGGGLGGLKDRVAGAAKREAQDAAEDAARDAAKNAAKKSAPKAGELRSFYTMRSTTIAISSDPGDFAQLPDKCATAKVRGTK
ncbi:MAG: hypothetical protein AAF515_23155 [Pseudomonadota bacterium]